MRSVTIRDVAALAGVSVATASRVLSGHPATSPSSRERVEAAVADLGYRPDARARSLRKARTGTIGVLVSDVRNPFFAEIAYAVERRALRAGMATLVCNADESVDQQDRYLDLLVSQRVDAMVVAPQGDGSGSLQEVLGLGIPIVFVDRTLASGGTGVPSITSDNRTGLREAVTHLAGLGHRRVGLVAGPHETSTGRERLRAYRDAAAAAGLDPDPALVVQGDFQQASGAAGARRLLDLADPPTAVVAADSLMTLGALSVLRERGVAVGADVSLVGYDDLPAFALATPSLTVVAHDPARMGALAADAVRDLLAGRAATSTVLPTHLVVRGSTGPARRPA
ncbi:LacI family DNA-binding transcriptional regulator [Isoptericola sp. BMS4]|uniref:LacI family DNA-binding transcriptional regulator n=1 Tax=Isoptericola sp. BMS4 TaxID=2527875 RepID=UPI00142223D5|nr:LacI family DNA-binding transcriptional regulator [Isoptericola sp. BMS4]